ncbi:MAG TPA: VOC family protein [Methylomirabilota bacterium]|nr:VOC family protein [Methylomirabilota bacterium]
MAPTRLDHIAIALSSIGQAVPIVAGLLGGMPDRTRPSRVFRWATWLFEGGGCLEVLEPTGPDGFLHRFLAGHGPGVHHVTFKVPDLDKACHLARAAGQDVVGRDDSDPSWKEAFLHPKRAQGIVVQMVEAAPPPLSQPAAEVPPGVADPPPPVRLLGLRLRARTRERAIRQWRGLLGGAVVDDASTALTFRWPDSPLRLTVEIDEAGVEGPVALEFASDRVVAGLAAASARLGICLTQRSA